MSDASCPRCGQGHPLSECPRSADGWTRSFLDDLAVPAGDLVPGNMVGEYQITGTVGEGGMGKVYAGVHPLIGRKVAIKVISRALSRSDEGTARFLQEARAVSALRHRNIVDVFAFGQLADGRHYQVMELLEGENLGKVLARRGPLPLAQTRVITRAILSALDAAHKRGIIHRDIKPDNVVVLGDPDGPLDELEVKILDFGLAKQRVSDPNLPPVITRLGFPMGTPAYMSPEQCRGTQSIDARADVYAAGVVLYEMLTGRVPFLSDAALEVMTMQIGQPPPSPSSVTPVPLALEQVVLRALAKDPAERFESAADMLAAFETACRATPDWRPAARPPQADPQLAIGATLPLVAPPPAPPPAPASAHGPFDPLFKGPVSGRRRSVLWLGAAATVGLLAIAVLRGSRGSRREPAAVVPATETTLPIAAPLPAPPALPAPAVAAPAPIPRPSAPTRKPARGRRKKTQDGELDAPINPYAR